MTNQLLITEIQSTLNNLISKIEANSADFSLANWKTLKGKLSSSKLASLIQLNEGMLNEFEEALRQFYTHQNDSKKGRLACLRVALWLETITKNMSIPFEFEKALSSEEIAIKQVRALELIIRDVITEQLGGKENVILKLQELFKQDVIDKWIKSADQSGILSGTTFSELSNILLDKNIFKGIEEIFHSSEIELSKSTRDSLRYILEDIRVIRNAIAHNKKVSNIQIEALNEYYKTIAEILKNAKKTQIDPDTYLDLSKSNMEDYISYMKEDNKVISGNIESIKETVAEIKIDTNQLRKDTSSIKKRTQIIISGLLLTGIGTVLILFYVNRQSNSSEVIVQKQDVIIDQISDLQNLIGGASPIFNPKTPKEYIVNAYLYKNAGDLLKAESMFKKFIEITKLEKFDIYYDYLDVLESNYGKNEAKEIITSVSNNSNICKLAITFKQKKLNIDEFDSLLSIIKVDSTLVSFIQFLNSPNKNIVISNKLAIKDGFFGYQINNILKLINWRSHFGDKYENLQKYFYIKNGPFNYACKNTDINGTSASFFYITMLRTLKQLVETNFNKTPVIFSEFKINPKEYNMFSTKEIDDLINKESSIQ